MFRSKRTMQSVCLYPGCGQVIYYLWATPQSSYWVHLDWNPWSNTPERHDCNTHVDWDNKRPFLPI